MSRWLLAVGVTPGFAKALRHVSTRAAGVVGVVVVVFCLCHCWSWSLLVTTELTDNSFRLFSRTSVNGSVAAVFVVADHAGGLVSVNLCSEPTTSGGR